MAQQSSTPEPVDRANKADRTGENLPGMISLLVTLNLVFGGIGVGYGLLYTVGSIRSLRKEGSVVTSASKHVEAEVDWTVVAQNALSLVLAMGLAISAFGLRRLKQWGRRLALVVAAGMLVYGFIQFGYYLYQISQPTQVNNRPDTLVRIVAIGVGCTDIIPIVYSIVLCVILLRRKTSSLFVPSTSAVQTNS